MYLKIGNLVAESGVSGPEAKLNCYKSLHLARPALSSTLQAPSHLNCTLFCLASSAALSAAPMLGSALDSESSA